MISVTNGTARVAPSAAGHQADAKTAYAPIAPVHIVWHDCPEAVDAAYWRPACEAEGVTLEELRGGMSTGVDEDGNEIEITQEQTLQAMRSMGFWGFVDTKTRTIHAWADPATPDNAIMEFLGHEIGHITGQPDASDWEEEMRADQYGGLVKMAHSLLLTRPVVGLQAPAATAMALVSTELERAMRKFPMWPSDPLHALAILGEEFGELTKDMLQLTYEPYKTSPEQVRIEAVQTAAMALRLVMSLSHYVYASSLQHSQTQPTEGGAA